MSFFWFLRRSALALSVMAPLAMQAQACHRLSSDDPGGPASRRSDKPSSRSIAPPESPLSVHDSFDASSVFPSTAIMISPSLTQSLKSARGVLSVAPRAPSAPSRFCREKMRTLSPSIRTRSAPPVPVNQRTCSLADALIQTAFPGAFLEVKEAEEIYHYLREAGIHKRHQALAFFDALQETGWISTMPHHFDFDRLKSVVVSFLDAKLYTRAQIQAAYPLLTCSPYPILTRFGTPWCPYYYHKGMPPTGIMQALGITGPWSPQDLKCLSTSLSHSGFDLHPDKWVAYTPTLICAGIFRSDAVREWTMLLDYASPAEKEKTLAALREGVRAP